MDFQRLSEKASIDFNRETNNLIKTNLTLSDLLLESTLALTADSKQQAEGLKRLVHLGIDLKDQLQGLAVFRTQVQSLIVKAAARLEHLQAKIVRLKVGRLEEELQADCQKEDPDEENSMSAEQMQQLLLGAGVGDQDRPKESRRQADGGQGGEL